MMFFVKRKEVTAKESIRFGAARQWEAAMHRHRGISRRNFLVSTASATVGTLLGDWSGVGRADKSEDDLAELSVVAATAAIRKGDISAERYAEALLARCDRFKHLNAFVAFDRDAVMRAARDADRKRADGKPLGALHGIPLAIKDNITPTRIVRRHA